MTRPKKSKRKGEDKRKVKENGSKVEADDQGIGDKSASITSLFKSEELQEISTILDIVELDDSHSLMGAVALSRFDIVKKLLQEDFPINSEKVGTTPLILAVKLKLIEMADFLIRRGADLCQGDSEGNNALLLAAQHADWDQESFLDFWSRIKESNVNVNHSNKVGHTILHCLVKRQWASAIEIIVKHSTSLNINHVTGKGVTALMMACSRHQEEIIKCLLRSNADLFLEDHKGCTALCYAIAYFIQKKMFVPNPSIEQLITCLEMESSIIAYLNRRLQLLTEPPEENFAITMSTVIVHIITFTVRCLDSGMEILLRLSIFKRIREAAERHMHDGDYVLGLLGIASEAVRHCECCCSNKFRENLVSVFHDSGIPNICIQLLKRFSTSPFQASNMYSALLPIILTCCHSRMKFWLQKNFNSIMQHYTKYTHGPLPPVNFYPDEAHSELVKKNNIDFKVLMNQLRQGELIHNPDKGTFSERRKTVANSFEAANLTDLTENNEDCRIRFNDQEEENISTPGSSHQRRIEIICDEPSNRIKLMKRAKYQARVKPANIKINDEGGYNSRRPISRDKEQTGRFWMMSSSRDEPTDKSDVSSEFCAGPQGEMRLCSNWTRLLEDNPPLADTVTDIDASHSMWEPLGDVGSGDMVNVHKHEGEINDDEDYSKTLQELNIRFYKYLSKYEEKWQKEFEEGYPDASGDVDDYLKLMETLPQLEVSYWNLVTQNWTRLVEKLEKGLDNNQNDCKSAIAGLKIYLNRLEEEDVFGNTGTSEQKITILSEQMIEKNNEDGEILDLPLVLKTDKWGRSNDADIMNFHDFEESTTSVSSLSSPPPAPQSLGAPTDLESNDGLSGGSLKGSWISSERLSQRDKSTDGIATEECWKMVCKVCQSNSPSTYCKVTKYTEQIMILNQISHERLLTGDINHVLVTASESEMKNFRLSPMGGVFGPAMLVLDSCTHQPVVVKSILKNYTQEGEELMDFYRRIVGPLLVLHSEHIVPYSHCLNTFDARAGYNTVLGTPLCERNLGEYLMLLKSTAGFSEDLAHMMVNQIVQGLHFLHAQKPPVVHGNMKPSNILADSNGNLRLSEFGLNEFRRHMEPTVGLRIWWAQETLKHYDCGELIRDEERRGSVLHVTTESDIQTCGMILHYLATGGIHPFGRYPMEIMINLNENRRPALATKSCYISDLVAWMLDEEPGLRPTSWQILNHVYTWDKDKQWRFLLTCAGISTDKKITMSVENFHRSLDQYASDHKVAIKWVGVIQWAELTPVLNPLDYSDTISGLLALLRDTLPSSANWFLKYFPKVILTLYRLIENTAWMDHPDFAQFSKVNG